MRCHEPKKPKCRFFVFVTTIFGGCSALSPQSTLHFILFYFIFGLKCLTSKRFDNCLKQKLLSTQCIPLLKKSLKSMYIFAKKLQTYHRQ
jgi:hypothetical protein